MKNQETAAFLRKAEEALAEGRTLLSAGHLAGAVGRAYYAMFHSAQAMLAAEGERLRTHAAVHRLFSERFVKAGVVRPEHGRWLVRAFNLRTEAEYGLEFDPESGEIREVIEQAGRSIAEARAYVDQGRSAGV